MRQLIRHIYLSSVGWFSKISPGVHIMNSHYLDGPQDEAMDRFYNLLRKLRSDMEFVNFQDAVEMVSKNNFGNGKYLSFSFDDGYRDNYTSVWPVLRQFNVNACVFVNPGFIDIKQHNQVNFFAEKHHTKKVRKPMTWEMIRQLASAGFKIGDHSYNHIDLGILEPAKYPLEILMSKQRIEREIGEPCEYFAWPYGKLHNISQPAIDYLLENYEYIFSSDNSNAYFSYNNERIINRRHFEASWPIHHVKYFLSFRKTTK